jgi:LmbE family N-acetylglucosaminyl deacetylase
MRPGSASSAQLRLPPLPPITVLLAVGGLLALLAYLAVTVAGGAPAAATGVNVGPPPLEPAATGGLATLDRALAKLATHKRVLVIGAHPDDEDTALLTLVSRGMGGEAAYLSLSRGEGGQNLIGPELGVGLGLIRSRELLAARAIDGGRQFFTRAYDFGYTLSLDETFGEWPKAVLVEDVVRVMRRFKPQVVVSIFPGVPSPTHGQHQAAGISAFAAYPLAGDRTAMPGLAAEGLAPWAPQALYRSAFFDRNAPALTLSTAAIDPWSGRSDYQLAMASRSMHRSQDMGRLQNLGPQETRVTWAAGGSGPGPKDLFAGIDTHLHAIADTVADAADRRRVAAELDEVEALAGRTREQLNPARLDLALPPLLQIVGHLRAAAAATAPGATPANAAADLIGEKLQVAETAAAAAAGIALDATTDREALVDGETFAVHAGLWNSGAAAVTAAAVELTSAPEVRAEPLRGEERPAVAAGALATWDLKPAVPAAAPPSLAYFLRRPLAGSLYDWSAATPAERGEPFGPPVYTARFTFAVDGVPLTLEREVVHLHRDEVHGEVRRPLRIVPAVEVAVAESMQVWPLSRRDAKSLTVVLTSHRRAPVHGRLELTPEPAVAAGAPAWPAVEPRPFELPAAADDFGEPVTVALTLRPPAGLAAGRYPFHLAAVLDDGTRYDLAVPPIDYEHIPPTPFPHRAAIEVSAFDLKLPALHRVGYVRGASDRVPEFLRQAGVPLEMLGPVELASGDLSHYDAIVIGSRAYESDPALARANSHLLAYVRGGGLMIVQYQQYPFVDGGFAPYKLEIARPHDRVTDETAPVKLLDPASPAFNAPNRIGDADWQGWLQERGLYFAHTWDPAYRPLLAMADPGGPEQRGSLLVASVGKGRYVYTGLALFRQLPGGVPGGYRLFANLLALR